MSYQDQSAIVVNHANIKQVVDLLLPSAIFRSIRTRSGSKWKARMLAVTAILWALSDFANLGDRFNQSRKIVQKIFRWQPAPGESYQGFIKMLRKLHSELQLAIVPYVRVQMKELLPGQWEIAGYVVFAADGSRIELARTESLEEAFSPTRRRKTKRKQGKRRRKVTKQSAAKTSTKQTAGSIAKKKSSPQMWLTMLWHVGSGLPWAWRTGPSDSSERAHLKEMLGELPENSLITADAGFVGYEYWHAILDAGHNFVIRVGSNVNLIRKLGYAREYDHTVYLWPNKLAKKLPPLVLRLIVIHNGKHPVYLVTNLSKSQLSNQQAAATYAARWGVELFFRTFKQTFDRRKLRSRSAANATLELDWSLMGLWCACFLGEYELSTIGRDPRILSAAKAIRAFQGMLRDYRVFAVSVADCVWFQLQNATLDEYQRKRPKTSRNYPRKKKRERIRPPIITRASNSQIDAAQELKHAMKNFQLSA